MNIYNDDCFNILPTLDKESVDLVLVDLPYGQTACQWDVCIDLDKMWEELKRVGKEGTAYVFFTTTKFGYNLIKSNEKWFRYDLVWEKGGRGVGFQHANKMPLRNHEMIYVFYKKLPTYNPQMTPMDKPYTRTYNTDLSCNLKVKQHFTKTYTHYHPKSVQRFSIPNNNSKHSTQKPTDLCEWLIKTYSNENDLVLDFTMGSGSTGVACINTGRRFIGIEKDPEIFKVAQERLNHS